METALLILVWVGIVTLVIGTSVVVVTMLRLQSLMAELQETAKNVNTTSALVERVVEQGAKGVMTAMGVADAVKAGLNHLATRPTKTEGKDE